MAVEIVLAGLKRGDRRYQTKCQECETVFRFLKSDAREEIEDRDGHAIVIDCPVCEKSCWIKADTYL